MRKQAEGMLLVLRIQKGGHVSAGLSSVVWDALWRALPGLYTAFIYLIILNYCLNQDSVSGLT